MTDGSSPIEVRHDRWHHRPAIGNDMIRPARGAVVAPATSGVRPHGELAAQLAGLHSWHGVGPTAEFYRGAATALAWLVAGGPGPLTERGHARPVGVPALTIELTCAEELAVTVGRRRRHYVIGVEHALLWAGHETDVPPLPVMRDGRDA